MVPQGYLALVLHAHLPFVRHPEHEEFLEEDWLFEAITECYLPLLEVMDGCLRDGVGCRLSMSLTPPLLAMLLDPLLQERYIRRMRKLIELTERELVRTKGDPAFHPLAEMYHERFSKALEAFRERYGGNLVEGFKRIQAAGALETLASTATHAFLPVLAMRPEAVRAQVEVGLDEYRRVFGRDPQGFWLPECGFFPGLDDVLAKAGIRYTILEAHGLLHGVPRPRDGVYAPVYTPSGLATFGRDPESSKEVWSSIEGYPGDYDYRDFYRDVGFDLDYDYIRPYLHPDGTRVSLGIKYYRVTGKTEVKAPYVPQWAEAKAAIHAGNFMSNREHQITTLASLMGRPPIVCTPYDAELFGHWWYEGPRWLDFLFRKVAYDQQTLRLITPSEYLDRFPVHQLVSPSASSWGYKGYNEVWINGANDWIYPHLHWAGERMIEMAHAFPSAEGPLRGALDQAARELLLAQSSDWPFVLHAGTAIGYAARRVREHLGNFRSIHRAVTTGAIDRAWVATLQARYSLFPTLDYRVYGSNRAKRVSS